MMFVCMLSKVRYCLVGFPLTQMLYRPSRISARKARPALFAISDILLLDQSVDGKSYFVKFRMI